jgi:hypothetical protein
MMNNGTQKLDEILEKQMVGKPKPIGFDYKQVNKRMNYNQSTKYTPLNETFPAMLIRMPSHQPQHQQIKSKV